MINGTAYASSGSVARLDFIRLDEKTPCPFTEDKGIRLVTFVPPGTRKAKKDLMRSKANAASSLWMCGPLATGCGATFYAPKGSTFRVGLLFDGKKQNSKTLR